MRLARRYKVESGRGGEELLDYEGGEVWWGGFTDVIHFFFEIDMIFPFSGTLDVPQYLLVTSLVA